MASTRNSGEILKRKGTQLGSMSHGLVTEEQQNPISVILCVAAALFKHLGEDISRQWRGLFLVSPNLPMHAL